MMPNHETDRAELIQRVLSCSGALFRSLHSGQDRAWLTVDLTMPQLKALVCVAKQGGPTNGQIARSLGVGLSTMTGIVDRLAEQGLVVRREDPLDRRITRVLPTASGQELVDRLLRYRDEYITAVLSQLSSDQLRVVEQAFQYLVEASDVVTEQQAAEAVA
ncbi:MAG TPA: MarR family transcriptional regulator [Chloroflexota bacterium]|jgi:DNA-binding MarR family transcriptional regulator|nr:MarR family transcriptional regulator [Chloroflexota bacterium]